MTQVKVQFCFAFVFDINTLTQLMGRVFCKRRKDSLKRVRLGFYNREILYERYFKDTGVGGSKEDWVGCSHFFSFSPIVQSMETIALAQVRRSMRVEISACIYSECSFSVSVWMSGTQ